MIASSYSQSHEIDQLEGAGASLPHTLDQQETTGERLLTARRILPETIHTFGIEFDYLYAERYGWACPTPDGSALHWKAYQSSGSAKYAWPNGKPPGVTYYHPPDLAHAINEAGGQAWIASGIADVWALHSAGIHNALCWFNGELSLPADLVPTLHSIGVMGVQIAPDLDDTGSAFAQLLAEALDGSGIALTCHRLIGEDGSRVDIGKAWEAFTQPARSFLY